MRTPNSSKPTGVALSATYQVLVPREWCGIDTFYHFSNGALDILQFPCYYASLFLVSSTYMNPSNNAASDESQT